MTLLDFIRETAELVAHLSGVIGTQILLFRNTNNPEFAIRQKPVIRVSAGLDLINNMEAKPRFDGIGYKVLKTKKPLFLDKKNVSPGIKKNILERYSKIQACICLPLISRENIVGIIYIYYDNKEYLYDEAIEMLSIIANQAAFVAENYQLLEMEKSVNIADLSHTIRGKTSAITNEIIKMKRAIEKESETDAIFENLYKSTESLNKVVANYVKFSLDLPLKKSVVNIRLMIEEIIVELNLDTIVMDISIAPDLPLVRLDKNLIKEAFHELFSNTIRILKVHGGGKIKVKVSHLENKKIRENSEPIYFQQILIQIEDDGPGIKSNHKEKIWNFGFTLNPRETGIGLYYVAEIIKMHNGKIYEDGKFSLGAKFNILLPCR